MAIRGVCIDFTWFMVDVVERVLTAVLQNFLASEQGVVCIDYW